MKLTALLSVGLLIAIGSFAQQGTITGKILDSATRKTLPFATVTVFKARDTSIITYRLSNPDGEFKVPGLPLGMPLKVIITFSGYNAFRKDFTLTAANSTLHIDSVKLPSTTKDLDEVIVTAERPPVSMRNDTIEFNATAFKTLPNALVEDLLKKLPGVQVDADGNITVNGKPVNRILVDGKTFFGDDPKMASRNLPANIIDKVQVTDDKEELLRNGDDNINNVGKVVNITLKKGVKKGWFGKVYAGGGSDQRYEAGGIANIFRDTLQVSVLGYANNLNRPGFGYSDLMQAGGLQRSGSTAGGNGSSTWNNTNGSSISINGISFGGMQGNGGIATSKGIGFNINHSPNTKQSLFAQYFYGNVTVDRLNGNDTKQYNTDTVIENNTQLSGPVISNAHNMGIGGRFKPDSVTNILVTANYTIGLQDETRNSLVNSTSNMAGPLSYGNINQDNQSNTYYYRHNLSYTRLSRTKKGRRFTLSHNLSVNNRFNEYTTNAVTHYVYPTPYDSVLSQLRREGVPRTDLDVTGNYSEPLSKHFTLRVGSRYEYSKLNNGVNTFNQGMVDHSYDVLNPALSSNFFRESNRFYVNTGFEYKWKSLTVTPSARALFQSVNNDLASLPSPIRQRQQNLLPGLTVVYKTISFNYNKDVVLPSYTYLIPVTNNTNPYYIAEGNANLLPAERQNFSLNCYTNDPKRNLNIGGYVSASFAKHDVIQSTTVDAQGVTTTTPVNADGTSNFSMNYNINKQYHHRNNFIFGWNTGAYYSINHTPLLYNGESSWQTTWQVQQWNGISLNFNDKLELNTNYSIGYNFTSYTSTAFNKLDVLTHWFSQQVVVRIPKHVIWESNISYSYNGSISGGLPKDLLLWNAAINFTMLKDEKGVLKLSVYDILNRNNSIYASVSSNTISTRQTNVLGQYVMATFTYNIRTIGAPKKKIGGSMFLF
ncbi:outer membrane protein beta-barrel family-domain-containing protein [Russula earlei]|uniref:Outer membrane protein beta-barrel family-domain-containing protein n=1 Tax=Russula earlei TaxID=71964 RepID=A0ACC0TQK5_9AGAM|nr:outer membrane protein beta-barrel family-domain-containing protein [Russula earlei]